MVKTFQQLPISTQLCVKIHTLERMTTTTSFSAISSSSHLRFRPFPSYASPSPLFPLPSHIKTRICERELVLLRLNCVSDRSNQSEPETTSSAPPISEPSSSSAVDGAGNDSDISAYRRCAFLGGLGVLETAYLTYLKLTDSDAFCPSSGGSCNTILTSAYSYVFGLPLPLVGMLAYGVVAFLGLQLSEKKASIINKADGELILIGTTTSMAAASAYFLYILNTEFAGETCLYCLGSATLSFSLFLLTLKNFGLDKIQKTLGSQLVIAALVVAALTASYNSAQPVSSSLTGEIPYVETAVKRESSPLALSLAKHLRSIGAKLYGAFWCTHCSDQKEMFGREASKLLNYVECFPDGVKQGTRMAPACYDIEITGFPTWEINGKVLSGEKTLSELATISGMQLEDSSQ